MPTVSKSLFGGQLALKALILAGGLGTRLRPLTCTRPKQFFPIANRPILDLTLERLATSGVKEVVLAVNFMADELEQAYGESKYGIRLHYSRDAPPRTESPRILREALGTGGPVKQAEDLLGKKEPFFVMNGDILTNINYIEIMKKHRRGKGIGTIGLYRVEDPRRYGVVKLAKENCIIKFVEKPSKNAPSNLVNAGIYVFEPAVFDYIPAGRRCSIEREVFPKLAKDKQLFGHEIKGIWIDVGKPEDLIKANRLWLEARVEKQPRSKAAIVGKHVEIREAVAIDKGVVIGEKSVVGPNVSLGENVSLGKSVHIKNSIIFPRTTIHGQATINGALVGESVILGEKATVEKGCLIGDNATIQNGVRLTQNVKVCPWKEVSEDVLTPGSIM